MAVSLAEQIEEVAKTVRDRQRSWLDEGRRGRMLEETATRKTAHLAAAEATLRWLERNMGWIKAHAEAQRLADIERAQAVELAAARGQPIVQQCLQHFPDAEIIGIRDAEPTPDDFGEPIADPDVDYLQHEDAA